MPLNPKEAMQPPQEQEKKAASNNSGAKSAKKQAAGTAASKAPAKPAKGAASASPKPAKKEPKTKMTPEKAKPAPAKAAAKKLPAKAAGPKPAGAKAAAQADKGEAAAGAKASAAKTAASAKASAARELAQAKRAAAQKNAPRGSLYANAVKEGQVLPDLLQDREDPMGGIFAAAVQSGQAEYPAPGAASSLLLEEAEEQEEAPRAAEIEESRDEPPLEEGGGEEAEEESTGLQNTGPMPTFGRWGRAGKKQAPKAPALPKKLRAETPFRRRLGKLFAWPPLHAIGSFLYLLGFTAECRVLQVWRFLRDSLVFTAQLLVWLFGGLFRALGHFLKVFFQGLAEPFVRLGAGLANTRRVVAEESKKAGGNPAKAAVAHLRAGVKSHGHLVAGLLGLVLPLLATGALVFVVWSVLDTDYGLEVTVKGETIGYIQDETVLEDAKAMLRGRLKLAGDQNMEDWKFDSTMALARTGSFTSKDQLVNAMLRSGTADIVEGTGLYVDGRLLAVTTEGEQLKDYLDGVLRQRMEEAEPGATVSFVRSVECDPGLDDVFLSTSVKSYDDLVAELTATVSDEVRYTVQEGDNLGEIARKNNLMFETLVARNPALEGEDIDYEPEAGEALLIERAKPFLQVQTTVRQAYTEEVPYPVVEQETDQKAQGFRRVTQQGENGVQEVQDDLMYVDGELVDRVRVEELTRVVEEPVEQIIEIGTFDVSNREERDFAPVYTWPVPDYVYSSRGGGPGQSHRGRDINAPEGTPIYAANAGKVITAGWHYSYGNHVVIQHPDGLITLYAHASYLAVTAGQEVKQNQYIANVGNTGFSFGNHLHLEFQRQGGGLLNPDDYVVAPHGFGRG